MEKFLKIHAKKFLFGFQQILHLLCALCDHELFTASFSAGLCTAELGRRFPFFPIFPIDMTRGARSCCLSHKTARWRRARRASRMTFAVLSTRSYCAWPRDVPLRREFFVSGAVGRLPLDSPFNTCTRMLATIAFDGEQLYLPEFDSSAFWISRCDVVMSPLRVSIEIPPRSES